MRNDALEQGDADGNPREAMDSEKQQNDERDDQTDSGHANKKKIEEHAAYIEQRLRELAAMERRINRIKPLKRDV